MLRLVKQTTVVLISRSAYHLDDSAAALASSGLLHRDVALPLLELEDEALVDVGLSLVD
jgi:hypothetical protein